jgi:hypothetical protein
VKRTWTGSAFSTNERVLKVYWSGALSLVCEVALSPISLCVVTYILLQHRFTRLVVVIFVGLSIYEEVCAIKVLLHLDLG